MISYARARRILALEARLLPEEAVSLAQSLGRATSRAIKCAEALPSFDNSAMDGFALRAADIRRVPALLPVAGRLAAGDRPRRLTRGFACEIMTGAPLPAGADAVVAVESTRRSGCGRDVVIEAAASPGDYVRRAGTDFAKGRLVAAAGTVIEPRHLMALASLGITRLKVRRRPQVAVLSTGKELVAPDQRPTAGQIRDGSSSYLMATLAQCGCQASFHGIVRDDARDFERRIKKILAARPDVVLTTGAVSMGRHDFVTAAVAEMGARQLYHKVAVRPGKPGLAARFKEGPLFFGLPGNPVSTAVGLRFFVMPYLRESLGLPVEKPLTARLSDSVEKPDGLRCFLKARRVGAGVRALKGQGSFQIAPLLEADCWAVLPEAGGRFAAGTRVDVYPL